LGRPWESCDRAEQLGRFKVSPQIAGAIKAVPGVVQVEAL